MSKFIFCFKNNGIGGGNNGGNDDVVIDQIPEILTVSGANSDYMNTTYYLDKTNTGADPVWKAENGAEICIGTMHANIVIEPGFNNWYGIEEVWVVRYGALINCRTEIVSNRNCPPLGTYQYYSDLDGMMNITITKG